MAIKLEEAWLGAEGGIVAVKKKDGGYMYFVSAHLLVNGIELENNPYISNRIANINFEIMEAKTNK